MSDIFTSPLNIKAWAEEDRPREKLLQKGRSSLTDAELLGILIGTGIKNMTAIDLAKLILQSVGNDLNLLAKLSVKDLSKFKGIGEAKAINIVAALELGRRRKETETTTSPKLNASKPIYDFMKPYLMDLQHEEFWVLILSNSLNLLKVEKISSGGITGTFVDPRMIFKVALDQLGSSVILVHNHPSGNLQPSQADKNLTEKIKNGGKLLDITLQEHLIFSNDGYFSFRDNGIL